MTYKIGFIGLGHMGLPMSSNLLKSKDIETLYVYDLVPESIQKLKKLGAKAATSIKQISSECDVIITMLQTGDQVTEVCLAEDGIFKNAKKDLLYIDCSSINIAACRDLHIEAENFNIKMLDAPVSGGVKGAETAGLTIMVGGREGNFEQANYVLSLMGQNIINAGDPGNGQVAKICNNMILGVSMIAVSEAFNLGEKLGLKAEDFFKIASKGSGECWSLTKYCPYPDILKDVPSSNGYKAGFTAQMMLKDLRLSQKAANSVDVSTPMGATASALYSLFVNADHNQEDFSAIIRFLNGDNN